MLVLLCSFATAGTYYCSTSGLSIYPYTNAVMAGTNMYAVAQAMNTVGDNSGNIIIVAEGIFPCRAVKLQKDVSIKGTGPATTILDGGWVAGNSVLSSPWLYNINLEVTDVTIQHGTASTGYYSGLSGGGLAVDRANSVVLKNCVIADNGDSSTHFGGGIAAGPADVTAIDCVFSNNMALHSGGGVWIYNNSSSSFTRCIFEGNMISLAFEGMGGAGGGLDADATDSSLSLTVDSCIFRNNISGLGGGLYLSARHGNSSVRNCLFQNNWALGSAGSSVGGGIMGGIVDCVGILELSHLTITGNHADYYAGGIKFGGGRTYLENSIIWGNSAPTNENWQVKDIDLIPHSISYYRGSIICSYMLVVPLIEDPRQFYNVSYVCTSPLTNRVEWQSCIDTNPMFVTSDCKLDWSSPCVGVCPVTTTTNDMRGYPRPIPGKTGTDMGCWEMANPVSDYIGDNIPTWWKERYGLNVFGISSADLDFDNDSVGNYSEWIADTDPTNNLSYLHINKIFKSTNTVLFFTASSNRTYTIMSSSNLVSWTTVLTNLNLAGASQVAVPVQSVPEYYRVRARMNY